MEEEHAAQVSMAETRDLYIYSMCGVLGAAASGGLAEPHRPAETAGDGAAEEGARTDRAT